MGHTTGDPRSVSLHVSYHKEQQYVWFRGGSEWFLRHLALCELEGWGIHPRDPRSVSLNASYHNEKQYIWFRGWVLNGCRDIKPYMNCGGPTVGVTECDL